jgi:hypothetical protein
MHFGVRGLGVRPARSLKRTVLELFPTTQDASNMMKLLMGLLSRKVASNLQILLLIPYGTTSMTFW